MKVVIARTHLYPTEFSSLEQPKVPHVYPVDASSPRSSRSSHHMSFYRPDMYTAHTDSRADRLLQSPVYHGYTDSEAVVAFRRVEVGE